MLPRSLPLFPGAGVVVVIVILLIVLIFIRMYVWGDRSRRLTGHRSGRSTAHRAKSGPERGGNHGHRAVSRRRPNWPERGKQQVPLFKPSEMCS